MPHYLHETISQLWFEGLCNVLSTDPVLSTHFARSYGNTHENVCKSAKIAHATLLFQLQFNNVTEHVII